MEEQLQNEQQAPAKETYKHKPKILCVFIISIVVSIIVSVIVVSIMQTSLRSDVKELQEKTSKIKIGK